MYKRVLTAIVVATAVVCSTAMAAASRNAEPPGAGPVGSSARLPTRPNKADWEKVKGAARMRGLGLAPHRTAEFRAFAGYLGLSELYSIRPLAPGPCVIALTYLRNNLLDLENAYPGENWDPLRRAVAKEPSIQACAPRPAKRHAGLAFAPRFKVARVIVVA